MSEEFFIPFNNTVVTEGTGDAKPLPENTKLLVTILQTKKEGAPVILKRPYSKEGENSAIPALAIRFRVSDGNERGVGRNLFADIPLARNLKSTGGGKYPDGTPAHFYFQFFRALGYNVDLPEGFRYPGDAALLGQEVEVVLGLDAAESNPQTGEELYPARNRVKFINKATGFPDNTALFAKADRDEAAGPAKVGPATAAAAATGGWTPSRAAPVAAAAAPAATGWQPTPPTAAPVATPAANTAAWSPTQDVAPAQQQAGQPVAATF